jgi:hypothetical protein
MWAFESSMGENIGGFAVDGEILDTRAENKD